MAATECCPTIWRNGCGWGDLIRAVQKILWPQKRGWHGIGAKCGVVGRRLTPHPNPNPRGEGTAVEPLLKIRRPQSRSQLRFRQITDNGPSQMWARCGFESPIQLIAWLYRSGKRQGAGAVQDAGALAWAPDRNVEDCCEPRPPLILTFSPPRGEGIYGGATCG